MIVIQQQCTLDLFMFWEQHREHKFSTKATECNGHVVAGAGSGRQRNSWCVCCTWRQYLLQLKTMWHILCFSGQSFQASVDRTFVNPKIYEWWKVFIQSHWRKTGPRHPPPHWQGILCMWDAKKTKEKSQHLSTGFFFILYFIILYGQVLVPVAMP